MIALFSFLSSKQKLLLSTVLFFSCLYFLYLIQSLIIPFLVAFFLSYILISVVDQLELWVKNRILAVLLLFIIFFVFVISGFLFLMPPIIEEFNALSNSLPQYIVNMQTWFNRNIAIVLTENPYLSQFDYLTNFQNTIQPFILKTIQKIPNFFVSTFSFFSYFLFILLLMFFFLLQGHSMMKGFLRFIPNRFFEMVVHLFISIGEQISNYIRGILIESVVISTLTIGMLFLLGADYAILLGIFAGIFNAIPYIGPVIAAIPAILIFYFKMKTIHAAVIITLGFLFIQSMDSFIIKPIIFSQSVNLHPLVVFVGLIVGGILGGIWGLVLAVPIMGSIKVSYRIINSVLLFHFKYN